MDTEQHDDQSNSQDTGGGEDEGRSPLEDGTRGDDEWGDGASSDFGSITPCDTTPAGASPDSVITPD